MHPAVHTWVHGQDGARTRASPMSDPMSVSILCGHFLHMSFEFLRATGAHARLGAASLGKREATTLRARLAAPSGNCATAVLQLHGASTGKASRPMPHAAPPCVLL